MKTFVYFTIFLISGIWLTSCKSSRNLEIQKQIEYSEDFKRMQSLIESLRLDVHRQIQQTTEKLSNLKVENKTVYLSPPDSTGKQYPVKESTTTASKDEQERQQVDENYTLVMQRLYTSIDSLNNKVNALMKVRNEVIELSWWDLYKDRVYCISIGLLIIGWLLYRIKGKSYFAQ